MRKLPRRKYDPTNRDQVLNALRQSILAAQLKVTLDEQLGRETSPKVLALSKRDLPPLVRVPQDGEAVSANRGARDGRYVTARGTEERVLGY